MSAGREASAYKSDEIAVRRSSLAKGALFVVRQATVAEGAWLDEAGVCGTAGSIYVVVHEITITKGSQ